jgi:hypothetical protein
MEGVEQIKVKYTHSRDTLRNSLNIGLDTNNKKQDSKIGIVCMWGPTSGRKLRGRDDGGNVNNVQYKSNQNCHYESPPV